MGKQSEAAPVPVLAPHVRLADDLRVLAQLAGQAGSDGVAGDATALSQRVGEGRFFTACVGQFKRGKSTLLNALVGHPVLPTGVVPITSAVTVLRHGSRLAGRVQFLDGRSADVPISDLALYVSEEHNPENRKGVAVVEAFVPAPLLRSGLCLVDTPGIGSVFSSNTQATRAFVPHVDAALIVVGADPPISGDELQLVEEVGHQTRHLIVALNKADRLPESEAREAAGFAERVVASRLGLTIGPVLLISATERLAGRPSRDWNRLEAALAGLVQQSEAVVDEAGVRGVQRLGALLDRDLAEQRAALARPIDESERRLEELRATIGQAGQTMRELGHLFGLEQEELAAVFRARRDAFLAAALPPATAALDRLIEQATPRRGGTLRARAMDLALEVASQFVFEWLKEAEPDAEARYRNAMDRFVQLANGFAGKLAASGDPLLDALGSDLVIGSGFRAPSEFSFKEMLTLAGPGPLTWVLDWVRPRRLALASVRRGAREYLKRLLETNSARVANDLNERVLESRRALETELRGRLKQALSSAERAVARARERNAAGRQAVEGELSRLAATAAALEGLLMPYRAGSGPDPTIGQDPNRWPTAPRS